MRPSSRSKYRVQLDVLNFALADVKGAFGPYVGIFLMTQENWNQAAIGGLKTFSGLVGLAFNAPIGAFIDVARFKRGGIVTAVTVVSLGAVAVAVAPNVAVVIAATAAMAIAGDVFKPAVAAITLGLLPRALLSMRFGRNSAFDHAGNVAIAIIAGAVGWSFGQSAVFFLVPFFAAIVALAVLSIPVQAIDHDRARGGLSQHGIDEASGKQAASFRVLIECRPLLVFCACTALFHFANAPMLHLVGQKLALAHPGHETAVMSACVIAAQSVMVAMALLVGAKADSWGRKPLFLAGFLILPIRGVLYTLWDNSAWLIAVQLLDGIGNGIYGALAPLVLADLMRGTGRYNAASGMVATFHAIGASVSNSVAGIIVVWSGYNAAFLTLATVAFLALILLIFAMPETVDVRAGDDEDVADRLDRASSRPATSVPSVPAEPAYAYGMPKRNPEP